MNEAAETPLVSIIVPAYNNGDIVERSLLSLVGQKYPNKEIIVVYDEGSSDNTLQAIGNVSSRFPNLIKMISVQHMGRSRARNIGSQNARGEIFFFADADDIYNEDYTEKAVTAMLENTDVGGVTVTGASLKLESTIVTNCIEVYSAIVRKLTDEGKLRPKWAWVYRREAIEKVGGFDENLSQAEDKDLYLRVQQAGYSFGFVGGVNWWHTRRGGFTSHLRKSRLAGKRRIAYVVKHREYGGFVNALFPFWALIALFILSFASILFLYFAFALMAVFILYELAFTLWLGWRAVQARRYLFIYSFYWFVTYLATCVGYNQGILLLVGDKIGVKKVDWSKI